MTGPTRRALVIAHETDGDARLIEERLRQRGFEVDTHYVCLDYDKPNDAQPFPSLAGYDVLVPMGSVRSLTATDEIDTWIFDELALVRTAHADGLPVLGVCFGGQLIATALGGSVERAPEPEFGWHTIDGPDNPVGPGPWMQWHHDRIVPPPDAEVLATNARAVQLFRIGSTIGTQFHPEVNPEHMELWLQNAPDDYLDECGIDRAQMVAEAYANDERNRAQCFALVDWFLAETGLADPGD